MEDLKLFWERFLGWVKENKQIVGAILFIFLIIGFYIYINTEEEERSPISDGYNPETLVGVEKIKDNSEELDELFSELEGTDLTSGDEYQAFEVDLFLKKPFVSRKELEEGLRKYINIYKWKTGDTLLGLKINVFDRKEVYDKDLEPRVTVYFSEELTEEDLTYIENGGTREKNEDTNEVNFQETIIKDEAPEYEEYKMTLHGFDEMEYVEGIEPLSDQEFSFYLKMELYKTLSGDSDYGSTLAYLQWDLGKDIYQDGIKSIEREVENFRERHMKLGGQDTYYDNEYKLKQDLAVEKPQFLLFITEKEIEEDPLEAQKLLLESNPDLYEQVLNDYIEKRSEDLAEEFGDDEEGKEDNKDEKEKEDEAEEKEKEEEESEEKDKDSSETEFEFEDEEEDDEEEKTETEKEE